MKSAVTERSPPLLPNFGRRCCYYYCWGSRVVDQMRYNNWIEATIAVAVMLSFDQTMASSSLVSWTMVVLVVELRFVVELLVSFQSKRM